MKEKIKKFLKDFTTTEQLEKKTAFLSSSDIDNVPPECYGYNRVSVLISGGLFTKSPIEEDELTAQMNARGTRLVICWSGEKGETFRAVLTEENCGENFKNITQQLPSEGDESKNADLIALILSTCQSVLEQLTRPEPSYIQPPLAKRGLGRYPPSLRENTNYRRYDEVMNLPNLPTKTL